jgi:hypothetical protein
MEQAKVDKQKEEEQGSTSIYIYIRAIHAKINIKRMILTVKTCSKRYFYLRS